MANLIIVESPAKADTIKHYLGKDYQVIASKGHIRDLPKSSLGIDVNQSFEPHYINIRGKGDLITELKKAAKKADKIYLATDPDREGEAISWHIQNILGINENEACRITFNEVTKKAVMESLNNPRTIDMNLVNAQQSRRILDRIVGYELSPFLWEHVQSGLSAGRVQSVATRMICDRENEIKAFVPEEYWSIIANIQTKDLQILKLSYIGEIKTEKQAQSIKESLNPQLLTCKNIKSTIKTRYPSAPFSTSTLQQEASKHLNFQAQHTMSLAQKMYEGIDLGSELGGNQGLITYIRTDSLRVSEDAQKMAEEYIKNNYGKEYYPKKPNVFKTKANAQDAHEAIRPVNLELTPKKLKPYLKKDELSLYTLIWNRFIQSQMNEATINTQSFIFENGKNEFKYNTSTIEFKGFLISQDNYDDVEDFVVSVPMISIGDSFEIISIELNQHFTEPPQRYTDASLVKDLEESGIGRPSTFSSIISTIISRDYVKRKGKSLIPTNLGELTNSLMMNNFSKLMDYDFTAHLEEQLDNIGCGETSRKELLAPFYQEFIKDLELAQKNATPQETIPMEESNYTCEKCGKKMFYRTGRFGKFLACEDYPKCRTTITLDKNGNPVEKKEEQVSVAQGMKCEICGADVVIRRGRFGDFYACSNFPTCKFTKPMVKSVGVKCPKCSGDILVRHSRTGKVFYSCEKYPECDYSTWDMPLNEKCPTCSSILVYKKFKKTVVCSNEQCTYSREEELETIE